MNLRQRQQVAQVADLVAEGSEVWREAADALSSTVPGLIAARSAISGPVSPEQLDVSLVELLTHVKRLAAQFDGLADRFAEASVGLRLSRRCK